MPNKILVAYASRTGSTAGVAEAIGQSLAESGAPVEVRLMQDVKDLAPYRAVVAGSAIHGRQWLPEAMQFMQAHRAALLQKPFAAFWVCMTLAIAKRWLAECVTFKDHTFPQLLLIEFAHDAADRIYQAIVAATPGTPALKPILRPYDTLGSTRYVDFDTTRPVYATRDDKCHISHVVADTGSWEQKLAQTLEDMVEVVRYVKNHNLGFTIPYTLNGEEKNYTPDFIACLDDGHGEDDLLHLLIEVTGEKRKDKAAKVATARTLWVPAVNQHGGYGRWVFIEVADPWDAENLLRAHLRASIAR